jgi:hypothetical protein
VAKIVISRIQNRRGLKADLPSPLRPGEIGLATDSNEVYIGLDPDYDTTGLKHNVATVNNVLSGVTYANNFINNNFIRFTIPSKKLGSSEFDGVTDSFTFDCNDSAGHLYAGPVFRTAITNSTNTTIIQNQTTNTGFTATDVVVMKNGEMLTGSAVTNKQDLSSNEYRIESSTNQTGVQKIEFGQTPASSDTITLNFYGNVAVRHLLESTSNIGASGKKGFYEEYSVPTHRQVSTDQIVFDSVNSTGWIALNSNIHLSPYVESTANISLGSPLGGSDNIIVKETANVNNNATISLNGLSTVTSIVSAVNSANTFIKAYEVPNNSNRIYLSSDTGLDITFDNIPGNLQMSGGTVSKADNSIKGQLEKYLDDLVGSNTVNVVNDVQYAGYYARNPASANTSVYSPSINTDTKEITFLGKREAQNFVDLANKLYYETTSSEIQGLMDLNTNLKLLTGLASVQSATLFSQPLQTSILNGGPTTNADLTFDSTINDVVVVEYSLKYVSGSTYYRKTGQLFITADSTNSVASLDDQGVEISNGISGGVTFSVAFSGSNIVTSTTNATGQTVNMKFIVRKWLG